MEKDKYLSLIERLYEKTIDGDRHWKQTYRDTSYLTSFPDFSVMISRHQPAENTDWMYTVKIYDSLGEQIDGFDETLFQHPPYQESDRKEFHRLMHELYREAVVDSRKNSHLDRLLQELA